MNPVYLNKKSHMPFLANCKQLSKLNKKTLAGFNSKTLQLETFFSKNRHDLKRSRYFVFLLNK